MKYLLRHDIFKTMQKRKQKKKKLYVLFQALQMPLIVMEKTTAVCH